MARRKRKHEYQQGDGLPEHIEPAAPPIPAAHDADPLAPVRVRNLGTRDWSASDFANVGPGVVPAGGEGVVTRKLAARLVAGEYPNAHLGVGPFEVVA